MSNTYRVGQVVKITRSLRIGGTVAEITEVTPSTIHAKLLTDGVSGNGPSYEYSYDDVVTATEEDIALVKDAHEIFMRNREPQKETIVPPKDWDRFDEDGMLKKRR